jgi:hypothetical protein
MLKARSLTLGSTKSVCSETPISTAIAVAPS